jgi:EmrB/QacA subfamily drug resistance transporter
VADDDRLPGPDASDARNTHRGDDASRPTGDLTGDGRGLSAPASGEQDDETTGDEAAGDGGAPSGTDPSRVGGQTPPPWRRVAQKPWYRWAVLAVVLLGLASSNVTLTILTAAVPFIARDLDTSPAVLSWVVAAPFLFRSVFVPTFGKMGDRLGRRRTWLVGLALTALFSLLCGFAWSAGSLVGFRAAAAIATAAVAPTSLAVIAVVFTPEERIKAMGYFAATMAMSPLIGVIAGGFIVEAVGWRWLFYLQFPIGLTAVVMGYLLIGESKSEKEEVFDYRGATLSVFALSGLILALNQGPEWGWSHPAVFIGTVVGLVGLPLFLWVETRASAPIVPLHFFRNLRYSASLTAKFFAHFAYMGAFFLVALFLEGVLEYSPSEVALGVSPRAASLAVMGPVAGFMGARFGARLMGVSGMALIVGSMIALGLLHADSPYGMVVPGLVLAGFGLGLINPSAMATVTNSVDNDDLGAASGTANLIGSIGASFGIAAMYALTNVAAGDIVPAPASAYRFAFLTGAAICVTGLIAAFFMGGKDVDARADDGRVESPPTAGRTPQTGPDTTKE